MILYVDKKKSHQNHISQTKIKCGSIFKFTLY